MKLSAEDKKKLPLAVVLGVCAIGALAYMYVQLFGGPSGGPTSAPAPAAPVVAVKTGAPPAGATAGAKAVLLSVSLDPTLHTDAMDAAESLVYAGTGRNIFEAGPSPEEVAVIEKAKFPARPITPPPPMPQSYGPPPKPPINLKFFGIATQNGKQRALLLSGEDVFLASAGDVVARRYRIIAVNARSVTVEDVPNNNRQDLPLIGN